MRFKLILVKFSNVKKPHLLAEKWSRLRPVCKAAVT